MEPSTVERLREYNSTVAEIASRCIVPRIVKGTMEAEVIYVCIHIQLEQKGGTKTPVRNMMRGALIDIVEEGLLDTISMRNGDEKAKFTFSSEALRRGAVSSTSFLTAIAAFLRSKSTK